MPNLSPQPSAPLRIVHVLRAPVGGLFRHVLDLAREQSNRGHEVGIIADSLTGGERAIALLSDLEPLLKLGLMRLPMRREPHPDDVIALWRICSHLRALRPHVIHGHGSKGGLYGRATVLVPGLSRAIRVYTPHGGSLHQEERLNLYRRAETLMARATDLFMFESDYISALFRSSLGPLNPTVRVAKNGLWPHEFKPIKPDPNAADFMFIGELSPKKGIDTLIKAMAILRERDGTAPSLELIGAGAERDSLIDLTRSLHLEHNIHFAGSMPGAQALRRGRILVAPSRIESLPYMVIEACAAQIPLIATRVGGVTEIFGPYSDWLIAPNDPITLADSMRAISRAAPEDIQMQSRQLAEQVQQNFNVGLMVDKIIDAYEEVIALKTQGGVALRSSPA